MLMFCPTCQERYDTNVSFCPKDGTRVQAATSPGTVIDPLIGEVVAGRYQVLERLGHGGMGEVYKARQEGVGRLVALKVLASQLAEDSESIKRFYREARVCSQLRHPNTVTLHDFGRTANGLLFIVMEFIEGESLSQLIDRGPVPLVRALHLTDQIAQSLHEAHGKGVVHRDVKPENVLLDSVDPEQDFARVLDFGIARLAQRAEETARLTETGTVIGTPAYCSPEQAQAKNDIDRRTDVYSLGVVLFHMLTGRLPFESNSPLTQMMLHVTADVPSARAIASHIPPQVDELLRRMLAKDPDDRPSTMGDVRRAIADVFGRSHPVTSPPGGIPALGLEDDSPAASTVEIPKLASMRAARPTPAALKAAKAAGVSTVTVPTVVPKKRSRGSVVAGVGLIVGGGLLLLWALSGEDRPESVLAVETDASAPSAKIPAAPVVTEPADVRPPAQAAKEAVAATRMDAAVPTKPEPPTVKKPSGVRKTPTKVKPAVPAAKGTGSATEEFPFPED